MPDFLHRHRVFRRLLLIWAPVIITIVVLRVTEPEVITQIGTAGATVITAVIGILATVTAFFRNRSNDDS